MQRNYATNRAAAKAFTLTLLGVGLLVGCGDSGSTASTSDDAAGAYAALSGKLQQCADEADACTTAANGDATKQAACDAAETACNDKTQKDQAAAHGKLHNAAGGCYKGRGKGHDEDGGVDEQPGRTERRACMEHHAPKDSGCFDALLKCLETKAVAGAGQNAALTGCVDDAHMCIMAEDMPKPGHGGPGHGGFAGGAPIGPGHAGGAGAPPTGPLGHGGAGVPPTGPFGHAGAASLPTGPSGHAGTGEAGHDGTGRGHAQAGAAPEAGHDGMGRGHGEAGAAGHP